jgi:hypothetical protein
MLYLNQLCLIYEQQNDGEALAKAETELEGLAESAHTVQELERQLINELRYEADPVRSAYLAMFIQSVHYGAQFQQILDRFGR